MITTDEYNGVCVLSVTGELSGDEAQEVRKIVDQSIDEKHLVNIAVDLQKCGFIDSEGLETLLWVRQRCEELFGMMKVVHADENCRKIFEITRLAHRLDVQPDLAAALKGMR